MSDERTSDRGRTVGLRIEGDRLIFLDSTAGMLSGVRSGLGTGRLDAAALERAIAEVEDLIMPTIRSLPRTAELVVSGSELAEVLALLPAGAGGAVSVESVESLFNQLADVAAGSPVAWRHAASPGRVALGLVVLREVMHHGGFRSVSLLGDTS
jgi:hypothetical protein